MSRARLRASSVSRLAVQDASRVGVQIPRLKKKKILLCSYCLYLDNRVFDPRLAVRHSEKRRILECNAV